MRSAIFVRRRDREHRRIAAKRGGGAGTADRFLKLACPLPGTWPKPVVQPTASIDPIAWGELLVLPTKTGIFHGIEFGELLEGILKFKFARDAQQLYGERMFADEVGRAFRKLEAAGMTHQCQCHDLFARTMYGEKMVTPDLTGPRAGKEEHRTHIRKLQERCHKLGWYTFVDQGFVGKPPCPDIFVKTPSGPQFWGWPNRHIQVEMESDRIRDHVKLALKDRATLLERAEREREYRHEHNKMFG